MVTEVRNLATGEVVTLPVHRPRGAEWYAAGIRSGLKTARGLATARSKQPLRGTSVLKMMKVYSELDWNGSGVFLGQAALGERAGVSAFTARRAQHWLVENGWLVVVARFKPGRQGWSVVLTIPDGDEAPFTWGEVHPPRRRAWESEETWQPS